MACLAHEHDNLRVTPSWAQESGDTETGLGLGYATEVLERLQVERVA